MSTIDNRTERSLRKLKSSKVTERAEGYQDVRDAFHNTPALDDKGWLAVFQCLFEGVRNERVDFLKKETAASTKRLGEAASLVRWIAERSHTRWGSRTLKALVDHLYQTVVSRKKLIEPIALDYAKTLRTVLSYQPHLDHLDRFQWTAVLHFSFSSILHDPIILDGTFIDEDDDSDKERSDAAMDADEDELSSDTSGTPVGKRKPSAAPRSPAKRKKVASNALSLEQIELAALIRVLACAPSSYYVSSDNDVTVPRNILKRFKRFFLQYPDSSIHYDMVVAMNTMVSNLSLNTMRDVSYLGHETWLPLIDSWSQKNRVVKEGLVLAFRQFLPFMLHKNESITKPLEASEALEKIRRLCKVLDAEAEAAGRGGLEILSLEQLRLEVPQINISAESFQLRGLRSGPVLSDQQALTWLALELHADCLVRLFVALEESGPALSAKNKKRDDLLSSLLNSIISRTSSTYSRVYRCQVLLFLIDRHWGSFHEELRKRISQVLQQCVAEDDILAQWALIALASICLVSSDTQRPADSDRASLWPLVWRRWNIPGLSRASCHAAFALIQRGWVSSSQLSKDIETMASEITFQGPPFPYDSVCAFLRECCVISRSDLHLYNLHFEDRCLSWLIESWNVLHGTTGGFNSKSKLEAHSVGDLLSLSSVLCDLPAYDRILLTTILPDGASVEAKLAEVRLAPLINYMLSGELSPKSLQLTTLPKTESLAQKLQKPNPASLKLCLFFERVLTTLQYEWDGKDLRSVATLEKIRRTLDFAVFALYFQATLLCNGYRDSRKIVQAACALISFLQPTFLWSSWSHFERAVMIDPLKTLLQTRYRRPELSNKAWNPLTDALSPDLVMETLPLGCYDASRYSESQHILWCISDMQETFDGLSKTLYAALLSIGGGADRPDLPDEGDGFGNVMRKDITQNSLGPHSSEHQGFSLSFYFASSVAIISAAPILQMQWKEAPGDRKWVDLITAVDNNHFATFALLIWSSVAHGEVEFGLNGWDDVLANLSTRLRNYDLSHNTRMHRVVVELLRATTNLWLDHANSESAMAQDCHTFLSWLINMVCKGVCSSWQVRDDATVLLDRCIALDPYQSLWNARTDEPSQVDDENEISPHRAIKTLARDGDVRVRYRGVIALSHLFQHTESIYGSDKDSHSRTSAFKVTPLYLEITNNDAGTFELYEHHLIRLVLLSNIMIMSPEVRRAPYADMLYMVVGSTPFTDHVNALLSGIISEIEFSSARQLFETYAPAVTLKFLEDQRDISRLPPSTLGYPNRRDSARAVLRLGLPTALGRSSKEDPDLWRQFAHVTAVVGISEDWALREIFPMRVALKICGIFDSYEPPTSEELEDLWKTVSEWPSQLPDAIAQKESISVHLDAIMSHMLLVVGEMDFGPEGDLARAVLAASPDSSQTLQHLTHFPCSDYSKIYRPSPPLYSASSILNGINWLEEQIGSPLASPENLYPVLQRLLHAASSTPLYNEKVRALNAVCLLCAVWPSVFRHSPALLRGLLYGLVPLFGQRMLSRQAQSIIHWGCEEYANLGNPDPRFPEFLVRLAYAAASPALSDSGPTDLPGWVDAIGARLYDVPTLKDQVRSARLLWPRTPQANLSDVSHHEVSRTLRDSAFSSNKFRLVRRFQARGRFSTHDFWALKTCIPVDSSLDDIDLEAYLQVLTIQAGRIATPVDHLGNETLGQKHQRGTRSSKGGSGDGKKTGDDFMLILPHHAIMTGLLDRLFHTSVEIRDAAYQSLRLLLSLPDNHSRTWRDPAEEVLLLSQRPSLPIPATTDDLNKLNDKQSFIPQASNFPSWTKSVTHFLCAVLGESDAFYSQLAPSIQADEGFAAQLFPIAVHEILRRHPDGRARTLISGFFDCLLDEESTSITVRQALVEACLHLRHFYHNPFDGSATGNNRWLDVSFTKLAGAAAACGAYTTSILFLELGREFMSIPTERYVSEQEHILYDIYSHIEEPDGFYGIRPSDVSSFLVRRFQHEDEWDKAFRFHGATYEALSNGALAKTGHDAGVVQSLHSSGFNHLAVAIQHSNPRHSQLNSTDVELAWRTGNWDLPIPPADPPAGTSLFRALRAIHREVDISSAESTVIGAIREEIGYLRELGNESMVEVRACVRRLVCLREVRGWLRPDVQNALTVDHEWSNNLTRRWGKPQNDYPFSELEAVMATRISLLRSAQKREALNQIGNSHNPLLAGLVSTERHCLLSTAHSAREASVPQTALRCVTNAQRLETETSAFDTSIEFAHVLWAHREEKLAIDTVDVLLNTFQVPNITKALTLSQQGEWLAAACLKPPMSIRDHYFDPAARLITEAEAGQKHFVVFFRYAMFAERQYQAVADSDEAESLRRDVEAKQREVNDLESLISTQPRSHKTSGSAHKLSSDRRKALLVLEQDSHKYQLHVQKLEVFLRDALEMFAECLRLSDRYDDDVITRLCSLWFRNFTSPELQAYISGAITAIPSRKFIFFMHQLSALLATSKTQAEKPTKSIEVLENLVLSLCKEHPFHSVYQVYALRMGDGSKLGANGDRADARRHAATNVLNQLRGKSVIGNRLRNIEHICDVYHEWAILEIASDKSQSTRQIPSGTKLRGLSTTDVPIPTIEAPVDPTCEYSEVIGIHRYSFKYKISGGVNLPKINELIGTDGKSYRQVFKGAGGERGGDDLRQDAVIKQVFELANQVLRKDPQTRRRKLCVRTYKVVPLTTQSGVLEFVPDSQPLQEWLAGAHKRFHKNDISLSDGQSRIREHQMKADRTQPDYPVAALKVFREVRARFHPVMRHYFLEKCMVPSLWFHTRLAYSRSVATTSVVGHIVGLGDRHVSNILLDKSSGELVHIDLGIAFDQGNLLPLPERVPFRLTADIVDGLGMTGTEGVFRRCSEETLRVLRDRSEVVETVLQVFKHDPLHSWTANPFKLKRAQSSLKPGESAADSADVIAGDNADRAIRGVRHKLEKSLSVQYTVNELITSATDENNLCLIFGGWSPHA
ncbi:hypothetical protein DL93DRAFT_2164855 [Clavulina sp. PMI_390]|nr:hypothetical protein DL93DRAFT_2164855 [Clavulina sp. PMI_390]